jgi:hypothetical protein
MEGLELLVAYRYVQVSFFCSSRSWKEEFETIEFLNCGILSLVWEYGRLALMDGRGLSLC